MHSSPLKKAPKGKNVTRRFQKKRYQTRHPSPGTHPQPSSHVTGRLGLCSQSLRCDCSWSRRRVAVQPKPALSQEICSLESMLRMMRGTGRRWARVTTVRSTGQICCWANHCVMQALQKACSQCGAWENAHRLACNLKLQLRIDFSSWLSMWTFTEYQC